VSQLYPKNLLCYGDNLRFLADPDLFPPGSVDLIYLDPPFNSQQSYNVLFKEATGAPEAAQIQAFEDTWNWDWAANEALTRITREPGVPAALVELVKTLMNFLKPSPMMAYLVQMAIRLVHMHRVLKPTGSLYLHCDPTASHYLKLILDAIFGPRNFLNEVLWQRFNFHADAKRWGRLHDVILFYTKRSGDHTHNTIRTEYNKNYIQSHFKADKDGRIYRLDNALGRKRGTCYFFRGNSGDRHFRRQAFPAPPIITVQANGLKQYSLGQRPGSAQASTS